MNFKLATLAAAFVGAATTAQAADLGRPAPAAVDYVKVCDAYGAGYFYIPGSDTCLKIGGYVLFRGFFGGDNGTTTATTFRPSTPIRGALNVSNVASRNRNVALTSTEAELNFDARTNTELGLLRSYTQVRWTMNSAGVNTATAKLKRAYIQFGGLTAGYTDSFFNFYTGVTQEINLEPFWSDHITNLIAYTFAFGNGISASVSIEDPTIGGGRQSAQNLLPVYADATWTYAAAGYGGHKAPDFVANVKIDQAWGSAQVMAALHDNYDASANWGDKWGYAIGAGVKVNLPMLAAGDFIALQATYASGALNYVSPTLNYADDYLRGQRTVAGVTTYTLAQTKAWGIGLGFQHNFTKSIAFNLDTSYGGIDQAGPNDYTVFRIIPELVWTPVKNLDIGLGVEYQNVNYSSATKAAYLANTGAGVQSLGDPNSWTAYVHLKRKF